ncbi:alginate lyase family protein [Acinetobacter rathckeae]|uniref:alginate lyase family protein n=1 Tax=Acinetobacter rathckeae TaxID=2605272 RepID=UPI0018A2B365|nr:alginate lyase family protein [Acinetobacter rathckeae]MBF7695393.1 alginate lyase family protein [Acinetobacter rathckeae]
MSQANDCVAMSYIQHSTLASSVSRYMQRQPHALPYLHTEGTLPNAPHYHDYVESRFDLTLMHNAALAWTLGIQADATLAMAKTYILTWVDTYQPSYNPIDESSFALLIDSYGMLRQQFSASEQQHIDTYLDRWVQGYLERMAQAPVKGTWINNWNSYRVELVTMIAFVLQNPQRIQQAKNAYQQQIEHNIDAKGITMDYKDRDAIHYVTYDLQPLLVSAYIAQRYGQNWYDWQATNGASLKKAIIWADPYTSGKTPHQEFAQTQVKFDRQRAAYGLPNYSGAYNPKESTNYYWQLGLIQPQAITQAQQLSMSAPFNLVYGCW